MTEQTPALKVLMTDYLHQDFRLVGDLEANVDEFVAEDPELASLLPSEVSAVVDNLDESATEQLVIRLGAEVVPPEGLTYREWLTRIADRVRTATT